MRPSLIAGSLVLPLLLPLNASGQDQPKNEPPVVFRDVLTREPLKFDYRPNQTVTDEVRTFHSTAKNPYSGDQQAISTGKKLYAQYCQACHLPTGKGQIGPSLVDDQWTQFGMDTDKGMFEIIYGGGAGAMQAFGRRMDQDQILKVMAYIETLRSEQSALR